MKKSNKITVLISFVLILFLAIGAASAADDAIITDDADLSAVEEVQAVDNTQTSDEIYAESTDIVVADTGDSGDYDIISDGTGLQEISDNGDEAAVVGDNVNPKNVLKSEAISDEPLHAEENGTFTDLYRIISNAPGRVVTLEKNYVYNPSTDSSYANGFTINGGLTINGNGHTIDGNGHTIDSNDDTSLFNLLGYIEEGLGIKLYYGYEYNFNDINFINFNFTGPGDGAVILSQDYPNIITISNCNFTNNSGNHGPAVYLSLIDRDKNYPGNDFNVTITGCVFKNNVATENGGAIYSAIKDRDSRLTINYNVFFNNTSPHSKVIYYVYSSGNSYAPNVDYNWWGQNDWDNSFVANYNSAGRYTIPEYSYQAALTQTDDDTVELTLALNGSSAPSGAFLPLCDAAFSISSGTIGPEAGVVTYGSPLDASFSITETATITATVDNQPLTLNIDRVPITVTSADVTVAYPNTASVAITASVAGTYYVKVGDQTYPVTIAENGGTASIPIPLSDVGEYGISVTADLGDPYIPLDTGVINYYKVIAGSITVTGQGATVTYPDKGTVIITTDLAGSYTVNIGDRTYENVQLDAGDNPFVVELLDANTYAVTVSANIPNYNPIVNQNIATYTVNKAPITVSSEDVTVAYPNTDSVTITASLAGYYSVGIGGYIFEVHIFDNDGSNTVSVPKLDVGAYPVTVSADIANYEPIVDKVVSTYTVNKGTVVVSVTNTTVGYPDSGSFTVTASVGGDYTVKYGTYTEEIVIAEGGGSYDVTVPIVAAGVYDISVTGTVDNYELVDTGNIGAYTVTKGSLREFELEANATTITYGDTISLTSNFEVYDGATASGTVSYYIDNVETGAIVSVDKLAGGTHTVVAKYTGDPNIEDTTSNVVTITVNKATPVVSLVADKYDITYGQSVTLTGTVSPSDATGDVTYYVNGVLVDSNVLYTLGAGTNTVVAKYAGNDNYSAADSNSITINVAKATSVVDLVVDKTEITYGESVTLNYVLSPSGATGEVTYIVDGEAVTGNVLEGLTAGPHTVYASYSGDDNFNPALSLHENINVNKATPVVTLSADKTEIGFGESITLTAVTPSGATGDVTYYVNGEAITGNVLSGLALGTYTVVAKYAGDNNYNEANSNTLTINVDQAIPIVSVTADPVKYGESGDVVVQVTDLNDVPLEGISVKVIVNEKEYTGVTGADGVAHVAVDILPVADYTIAVETVASGNYAAGRNYDKYLTVNKGDLAITVAPSATSVDYGSEIEFSSSIAKPSGTSTDGNVKYYVDGVEIDGSSISTLAAGTHTVVAKFSGDSNFNDAVSESVEFTVNKVASSVSVDPISFTYGGSASAVATLVGADTVTAAIADYPDAASVNGKDITVSGLPAGTYTMVVTTVPDDNHTAESINVVVTVAKADATVSLTADKYDIAFGESVTLTGTVSPSDATGDVTYYLDAEAITGNVLSDLAAGTYTVTAKYAGNENYNEALSGPITITVDQAVPIVSVTADPVKYGVNGDVVVKVSDANDVPLEGITVKVTVNEKEYTGVTGADGVAHVAIDILPVAEYSMAVETVASGNYAAGRNYDKYYVVNKGDLTITAGTSAPSVDYGSEISFTNTINAPEGTTTVGVVKYYVDGVEIDGSSISTLAAGTHTVVAKFSDDSNFNDAASEPVEFTVNKVASSVSVDPISFTYGGSASAVATLVGAETVTAAIADYPDAVAVNGKDISIAGLPAGTYTMVVTTVPDDNHTAVSIDVAVTVAKADATLALSADKTEITFGDYITLTAVVSPSDASGLITYYVDGVAVESNVLSDLAAGTYTVTAKYAGNENYNEAVSGPITITVAKAASSVSVDPISFAYGASGSATATLTGATGFTATIADYPDAVTVNGNEITVSGLPAGSYTMVVTTIPDADHSAVSIEVPVGVGKEDSSIALSADKTVIDFGDSITLTAVVSPSDATGTITYYVNGNAIEGNVLSGLAAGTYAVHAMYAGNDNYNAAVSNTITLTVNKITPAVSISASKEAFEYGEGAVLDVTVMDGETGVTGTVVVTIGTDKYAVDVTDGTGKLTVKGLSEGTYEATAKFLANDNYNEASAASAASFVVNAIPDKPVPTVSITVDPATIKETESATIKVSLVFEETKLDGIVIVTIGGTDYAVNVAAGEGSVTIDNLAPNTYTIKGEFLGDDVYAGASAEDQTLEVTKVAKVALNVTTQGSNIVIKLTDEDGNPVSGKVNVTIDGSTKEVEVSNGVATVPVSEGNHNVTVSYPGEAVDGGSQVVNNIVYVKKSADQKIKTKITVNKNQTITYNKTLDNRSSYYIYATLTDVNGKVLANKTVTFFAHKKLYVTKTNSKGQFRFCIAHVGYGECTHALSFIGDDDYEASFAVVCVSIKKQKVKLTSKARTFKATKKVKKLTATLKNSKGKALKGKKVTFVVNGKKYTAKTNKKGVATVKVKVSKKKTYKVKVTFAGDKTYAKKTVNRKLKIT